MGKRKKKPRIPATPQQVVPFEPEEFCFVMGLGSAAHSLRMPMESPMKQGVAIDMGDGVVQEFRLTDIPLNRAAIAIQDHFAPDFEKFGSFMWRFMALQRLRNLTEMEKYIKPDTGGEGVFIHSAVFEAAATLPLNDRWEFEPQSFFARVAELAPADDFSDS